MSTSWTLLDAHQMGRRVHVGVPDKRGDGFHDKTTHDIVACRETDGELELGVWGVEGVIVSALELVIGTPRKVIRILNDDQGTATERAREGAKDGAGVLGGVL